MIANDKNKGKLAKVLGSMANQGDQYVVEFKDGTKEVYDCDCLQTAARLTQDSEG